MILTLIIADARV